MDTAAIGQKIRQARRSAGLTQEDLGKRIGFSQVQVSAYERGDVTGITVEMLDVLARATHHPLSYFIADAPKVNITLAELLRQRYPDIEPETISEAESFIAWAVFRDRSLRSAGSNPADETSRADTGGIDERRAP